jgi:hypothetical protein
VFAPFFFGFHPLIVLPSVYAFNVAATAGYVQAPPEVGWFHGKLSREDATRVIGSCAVGVSRNIKVFLSNALLLG